MEHSTGTREAGMRIDHVTHYAVKNLAGQWVPACQRAGLRRWLSALWTVDRKKVTCGRCAAKLAVTDDGE